MAFTYNETQGMIRDTIARFLADTYDFDTRQKMIATDAGRDPGIWNALANELGLLGAAFDEEHGGLGGGALENALLMEEFGKVIGAEGRRELEERSPAEPTMGSRRFGRLVAVIQERLPWGLQE